MLWTLKISSSINKFWTKDLINQYLLATLDYFVAQQFNIGGRG